MEYHELDGGREGWTDGWACGWADGWTDIHGTDEFSESEGPDQPRLCKPRVRRIIFILRMMRSHWKILKRGVKMFHVLNDDSVAVWENDCT